MLSCLKENQAADCKMKFILFLRNMRYFNTQIEYLYVSIIFYSQRQR